jgi:hypothetical protein
MQQPDRLALWIGLVVILSLLAIVVLVGAFVSLSGESAPMVKPMASEPVTPKPTAAGMVIPTAAPNQSPITPLPARPAPLPRVSPTQSLQDASLCSNNAVLLRQVTSPQGSSLLPNQRFNQTWYIQNTGNCTWNTKFQLVHVQYERLSAISTVALPSSVLPGKSVDLTVAMVAPATPGQYISQWQLRDDVGAPFGATLAVGIRVNLPTPTACIALIGSFTADRTTINSGESTTLRWGAVTNGQRVEIDNGIGAVAAPGVRTVAPKQNTTYALSATCGGNRATKTVTIVVIPLGPTSIAVPPRRDIVGIWATDKYTIQIMDVTDCAGSECQAKGEFAEWGTGPPVPGLITGTFNMDTGRIILTITLQGSAKSFDGKVDASNKIMSGQLTGVGALSLIRQQ